MLVVSGEEVEHGEEQNNREVGERTLEEVTSNTGQNKGNDKENLHQQLTILISVVRGIRQIPNKGKGENEETDINEVKFETLLGETLGHKTIDDAALGRHSVCIVFV